MLRNLGGEEEAFVKFSGRTEQYRQQYFTLFVSSALDDVIKAHQSRTASDARVIAERFQ